MALTLREVIGQLATEALPWPGGTYRLDTNERVWDVILVTQTTTGPDNTVVDIYSPLDAVTGHTEYSCGYISTSIKYWKTAATWYMSTTGEPVNQKDFMEAQKLSTAARQAVRRVRAAHATEFNIWAKQHLVRTLYERSIRGCKKDLEAFNESMAYIIERGKEQMTKCDEWLASPTLVPDFHKAVGDVMFNPMFPGAYLRNTTSY